MYQATDNWQICAPTCLAWEPLGRVQTRRSAAWPPRLNTTFSDQSCSWLSRASPPIRSPPPRLSARLSWLVRTGGDMCGVGVSGACGAILQRVAVPVAHACLGPVGAAVAGVRSFEPALPSAAKNPASPPMWKNTTRSRWLWVPSRIPWMSPAVALAVQEWSSSRPSWPGGEPRRFQAGRGRRTVSGAELGSEDPVVLAGRHGGHSRQPDGGCADHWRHRRSEWAQRAGRPRGPRPGGGASTGAATCIYATFALTAVCHYL
jgi:hypothetical protein